MSDGRDILCSQIFWESVGSLAEKELALKLWIWPSASIESVGEADPTWDLNFMAGPHGIKSRRQRELPQGPCVGWKNGALGDFSYQVQSGLTEVGEKTETGRNEVHRRCNLSDTISFLVPSPLYHSCSFCMLLNFKTSFLTSLTLEKNWELYREPGKEPALNPGWKLFSQVLRISKEKKNPFCPGGRRKVKIWDILVNWKSGKEQWDWGQVQHFV